MAASRILVTGGAGFIGSHLAGHLLGRGYEVRALDVPSTNEVYGALEDVVLEDAGARYAPVDPGLHRGISEARGLAFHTPHGCSRGAAEQHVCGSSLPPWEGRPWFRYPFAAGAPGHEGWGRVAGLGAKVRGLAEGDRVAHLSGGTGA